MQQFNNAGSNEDDDNYSDEDFNFGLNEVQEMAKAQERKEAAQTKQLLDDAIVDEVEDEFFDEELMATEIGKNDARKLKELIGNIDLASAIRSDELLSKEKQVHKV